MVEHLVRLQLTLQRNQFRRSTWQLVGAIIGYAMALLYGGGVAFALFAIRVWGSLDLARLVLVPAMAVISLAFVLATLLVFGVDQTLDPARFAPFPLRARDLVAGLTIVGLLLGAGGLFLVVCALASVAAWAWTPLLAAAALVGGALGVLGTFLLSRVATSAFAQGLAGRRSRDMTGILFGLVAVAFGVGVQFIPRVTDPEMIRPMAEKAGTVLGWTPFGWGWAVPADVAAGNWALAGIHLVLALALVVVSWFGWKYFLDKALVSPLETSGGGSGKIDAHAFSDRLYPTSPWGAIAARSLKYWRRDPRRIMLLAMTLIMPVVWLAPAVIHADTFDKRVLLFGPPLATFFFAQSAATELSYDGSAIWTHITAGVRGWEDRLGRAVSLASVLGPVVLVIAVIACAMNLDHPVLCVASVAITIALATSGIGAGLFCGALWNVPTAPAGANAFAKSSGSGVASLISFSVGMLLTTLAATPTVALAVVAFFHGWVWAALALVVALATAAGMLWFGVKVGGNKLERRWPEVLKEVTWEG